MRRTRNRRRKDFQRCWTNQNEEEQESDIFLSPNRTWIRYRRAYGVYSEEEPKPFSNHWLKLKHVILSRATLMPKSMETNQCNPLEYWAPLTTNASLTGSCLSGRTWSCHARDLLSWARPSYPSYHPACLPWQNNYVHVANMAWKKTAIVLRTAKLRTVSALCALSDTCKVAVSQRFQ